MAPGPEALRRLILQPEVVGQARHGAKGGGHLTTTRRSSPATSEVRSVLNRSGSIGKFRGGV